MACPCPKTFVTCLLATTPCMIEREQGKGAETQGEVREVFLDVVEGGG